MCPQFCPSLGWHVQLHRPQRYCHSGLHSPQDPPRQWSRLGRALWLRVKVLGSHDLALQSEQRSWARHWVSLDFSVIYTTRAPGTQYKIWQCSQTLALRPHVAQQDGVVETEGAGGAVPATLSSAASALGQGWLFVTFFTSGSTCSSGTTRPWKKWG